MMAARPQGTEVATRDSVKMTPRAQLKAELDRFAPSFEALLPKGYPVERLVTGALLAATKNPALMDKITAQFQTIRNDINSFRAGDGYVSYDTVPSEKRKSLSDQIDALSQSLSQVPGLVLQQ